VEAAYPGDGERALPVVALEVALKKVVAACTWHWTLEVGGGLVVALEGKKTETKSHV